MELRGVRARLRLPLHGVPGTTRTDEHAPRTPGIWPAATKHFVWSKVDELINPEILSPIRLDLTLWGLGEGVVFEGGGFFLVH